MRVVAWNILHGGGRRTAEICLDLSTLAPDVVVLSEFREGRGGCLRGALADMGLPHHETLHDRPRNPTHAGPNGLLLASRWPLEPLDLQAESGRIRAVHLPASRLSLAAAHMPDKGQPTARAEAWHSLVALARTMACDRSLIIGDLNAGRPGLDGDGLARRDGEQLGRLAALGFEDTFRALHPGSTESSWWSHSGRGFRLDHALASASLLPHVQRVGYDLAPVRRRSSDHAPLVVDLAG